MILVTPKISATFLHKGRRVQFIKGRTLIEEGHPILRGREHMVEPVRVDYAIEKAPAKTGKVKTAA